jgi:hypothetical protein
MGDEEPADAAVGEAIRQFEAAEGVDVAVQGDASRFQLARRVIENWAAISDRAINLLESFMRDHGTFDLSSIEVFAEVTRKEGDFALRYTFIADRDPHEYNYTYFEVYFICHEPPQLPFWPFKFTVGFH